MSSVKKILQDAVANAKHAPNLRFNPHNQTSHKNPASPNHLNSYNHFDQAASPGSSDATTSIGDSGIEDDDINMTEQDSSSKSSASSKRRNFESAFPAPSTSNSNQNQNQVLPPVPTGNTVSLKHLLQCLFFGIYEGDLNLFATDSVMLDKILRMQIQVNLMIQKDIFNSPAVGGIVPSSLFYEKEPLEAIVKYFENPGCALPELADKLFAAIDASDWCPLKGVPRDRATFDGFVAVQKRIIARKQRFQ